MQDAACDSAGDAASWQRTSPDEPRLCLPVLLPQKRKPIAVEANAFIAELYRQMALRPAAEKLRPNWSETEADPMVVHAAHQYASHRPGDKSARILDMGFGRGWFLPACLKLAYRNA